MTWVLSEFADEKTHTKQTHTQEINMLSKHKSPVLRLIFLSEIIDWHYYHKLV